MSYEPRRVLKQQRVPLKLLARPSANQPDLYEVVTEHGQTVASQIANPHTARLLAAAPLLLHSLYEARWWIEDQVERNPEHFQETVDADGMAISADIDPYTVEGAHAQQDRYVTALLELSETAIKSGFTQDGLYPVDD